MRKKYNIVKDYLSIHVPDGSEFLFVEECGTCESSPGVKREVNVEKLRKFYLHRYCMHDATVKVVKFWTVTKKLNPDHIP